MILLLTLKALTIAYVDFSQEVRATCVRQQAGATPTTFNKLNTTKHTHIHSHTPSHTLTHTRTHTHTLSLSHTHTLPHTLTLTLPHTHTLSLSPFALWLQAIVSYTRLPLHRVCKVEYGAFSPEEMSVLGIASHSTSSAAGLLRARVKRNASANSGVAAMRIFIKVWCNLSSFCWLFVTQHVHTHAHAHAPSHTHTHTHTRTAGRAGGSCSSVGERAVWRVV